MTTHRLSRLITKWPSLWFIAATGLMLSLAPPLHASTTINPVHRDAYGANIGWLNSPAISGSTGGAGVGSSNPWANFSY